ncbi:hypothetical protein QWY95_23010, partial [Halomonas neptunia]|nr:hypothetical protein [Halomonas neptunia]
MRLFEKKPMPNWGSDLSGIDFDNIKYFVRSTEKQAESWEDLPEDIKNTYDKLGIPEAEKQRLVAGVAAQSRVAFGHRRLKIIDLSERAQQPMVDAELGLTLAFNGCIYNYRELRSELQGKGYRFFSEGDTEVVLKAWHAWGLDAPKKFHGMFAFAVHERDSGRVALCRDRLG